MLSKSEKRRIRKAARAAGLCADPQQTTIICDGGRPRVVPIRTYAQELAGAIRFGGWARRRKFSLGQGLNFVCSGQTRSIT